MSDDIARPGPSRTAASLHRQAELPGRRGPRLPGPPRLRTAGPTPGSRWVVNRSLRGLVDGHPEIDEVIPLRPGPRRVHAGRDPDRLRSAGPPPERRFDLTIDLQGLLRSGLMTAATMAPTRVGLRGSREGASWFYTHQLAGRSGSCHEVDRLLQVAEAFGADVARPRFVLAISDQDRSWARRVLEPIPRPRIILNPGARWMTKRWPPEHFAEVGRRAFAEFGAGLVAVGSGEDRPLVERFGCAGTDRPPRPLRQDLAPPARRLGRRSRPLRLERHRPAPPCRRIGRPGHRRSSPAPTPAGPALMAIGHGSSPARSGVPPATSSAATAWIA